MPKAWINVSKTGYMQKIYKKPHSIAHGSFSHMDKRGMAFYLGGGGGGGVLTAVCWCSMSPEGE